MEKQMYLTKEEVIKKLENDEYGMDSIADFIPYDYWEDREFVSAVVSKCGGALKLAPDALKTEELCLAAFKHPGIEAILKFVPEKLRTEKVCLAAVKVYNNNFKYVPEALRTEELCLAAVREGRHGDSRLGYVPWELRTEAVCLAAVKKDGSSLKLVPEKLRTDEICYAAVVRDHGFHEVIKYVPEAMRTEKICLAAVSGWGVYIHH
jgi:hypothetical protein